jgi:hypothetical protein
MPDQGPEACQHPTAYVVASIGATQATTTPKPAACRGSRTATSHITRVGLGHLARRSQTADLLEMLLQL